MHRPNRNVPVLLRQPLDEEVHQRLRRPVRPAPAPRVHQRERRQVAGDDAELGRPGVALAGEQRQRRAEQLERPVRVDVDELLDLGRRRREERAGGLADAGVGDDDVEALHAVGRGGERRHRGGDGFGGRGVHPDGHQSRALRCGEIAERLRARVGGIAHRGDDGVIGAGEVGGYEAPSDACAGFVGYVVVCEFLCFA